MWVSKCAESWKKRVNVRMNKSGPSVVFVSGSSGPVTVWGKKRCERTRIFFFFFFQKYQKHQQNEKSPRKKKERKEKKTTTRKKKKRMSRWRQNWRSCYFGVLLTGPSGRAINNLVQYLTWDLVSGGDILASFDAERAPSPKPLSPYSSSSLLKCLPWCYLCVGFL